MNYESPAEIKSVLEADGLFLKKRFGQNFLRTRSRSDRRELPAKTARAYAD